MELNEGIEIYRKCHSGRSQSDENCLKCALNTVAYPNKESPEFSHTICTLITDTEFLLSQIPESEEEEC